MNIRELKELLEDYNDEDIIMVAHQPGWPLRESLVNVIGSHEGSDYDPDYDEEDEDDGPTDAEPRVIYLVANGCPYDINPYAPRWVFESY